VVFLLLGLLWMFLTRATAPNDRRIAASTAGFLLLMMAAAVALPAQYVIERLNRLRPWHDDLMIRADLALGIDVRDLMRWTVTHPNLRLALEMAYRTFVTQTLVPVLCAYAGLLSVSTMRQYVWQFVVCLWLTLLTLWMVPVSGPYVWWSYDLPMQVHSAMASQLEVIRGESPAVFRFTQLEGLVALPSFHTMGALAVTVACWRIPVLGPVLVGVNTLLIASTVLLGIHYAVDVIAGAVLYAIVVIVFRYFR
jgi:membrane-associated phospholipid phosphatase